MNNLTYRYGTFARPVTTVPPTYAHLNKVAAYPYRSSTNNSHDCPCYGCFKHKQNDANSNFSSTLSKCEGIHARFAVPSPFQSAGHCSNGVPETAAKPEEKFDKQSLQNVFNIPQTFSSVVCQSKQSFGIRSNSCKDALMVNHNQVQENQNNLVTLNAKEQNNQGLLSCAPNSTQLFNTDFVDADCVNFSSKNISARILTKDIVAINKQISEHGTRNTDFEVDFPVTRYQQNGIDLKNYPSIDYMHPRPTLTRIRNNVANQVNNKPVFGFNWKHIESVLDEEKSTHDEYIGDLVDLELLKLRFLRQSFSLPKYEMEPGYSRLQPRENRRILHLDNFDTVNETTDIKSDWTNQETSRELYQPFDSTTHSSLTFSRHFDSFQRSFPDYAVPSEECLEKFSLFSSNSSVSCHVVSKEQNRSEDGLKSVQASRSVPEKMHEMIARPMVINEYCTEGINRKDKEYKDRVLDISRQNEKWNSNMDGESSRSTPEIVTESFRAIPYRRGTKNRPRTQPNQCLHLWEFLLNLLNSDTYCPKYIAWTCKDIGEFKLIGTEIIANLWGQSKKRKKMTYEKMARALRYYYKHKVLEKVPHKRLHFRFGRSILLRIRKKHESGELVP